MLKKIFSCILTILSYSLHAQVNYSVSYPISTFTEITSGTQPTLVLAYPQAQAITEGIDAFDEGAANNVAIPFGFNFNGTIYNTCHISTNGFLALGSLSLGELNVFALNNLTDGPFNGAAANSRASRPIIAPLWDDLSGPTSNYIRFQTSGTSPNRVFTIQWLNAKWLWQATSPVISFQVRLYETTNVIEFIYRQQTGQTSNASASVGLAAAGTGTGNFLSQSALNSSATTSSTTEYNNLATKPANNFCIRYTPTSNLPVSLINFQGSVVGTMNKLNWSTTFEVNNKGFEILRSVNGINFSSLGSVASKNSNSVATNHYSFVDNNPLRGNNYYQLKQVDADGKYSHSNIIILKSNTLTVASASLYPNPACNQLNVLVTNNKLDDATITITDLAGKVLQTKRLKLINGSVNVLFNIEALINGTYLLRLTTDNGTEKIIEKFVKQ